MKIIITGASDGIGKAISLELAKHKHELILLARNIEKLNEVKNEALKLGTKSAEFYSTDLSKSNEIYKFCKKIRNKYKSIDGLINNAGIWQKNNS